MTARSKHVYQAFIVGTPDVELPFKDGSVTLDAGRAPHVQASLRVSASPETLDLLDPRADARVRIVVDATTPAGPQHREFNLAVRERSVSQSTATVTLDLASDEALLFDYRPLVDDTTPLSHQASLRAIVNYVLNKAIPGAALEASPAHNGDMTTYTDADNVFKDPRITKGYVGAGVSIGARTDWPGAVDGVAHNSIRLYNPTNTDGFAYLLPIGSMNGVQVGETWVISALGVAVSNGPFHAQARRLVVFMNVGGYVSVASAQLPNDGTNARVSAEFTVPPGCTEMFIRAYHGGTGGEVLWSQVRLTKKSTQPAVNDTTYFWGGKPDTATYDYSWTGTADESASRRRAVIDRKPELLAWRAGVSALDFLHPLVQVHGLRLVCDEQRRWTLRDENYTAPDALAIRYGVNMVAGEDKIARGDGTWFDAAIVRYRWTDYQGVQQERVDSYAEPGATMAVEIIKATPWPGAGFAEYAVRRALQRGREVTVTAVSDWRARAEQPITAVLTGAPTQIGASQSVTFAFDNDEMRILTRTTDTPAGAIDLLTGTIDALSGTIDSL